VRFAAGWRSELCGIPTREWTESLLVVAALRVPSARLPSRLCQSRVREHADGAWALPMRAVRRAVAFGGSWHSDARVDGELARCRRDASSFREVTLAALLVTMPVVDSPAWDA